MVLSIRISIFSCPSILDVFVACWVPKVSSDHTCVGSGGDHNIPGPGCGVCSFRAKLDTVSRIVQVHVGWTENALSNDDMGYDTQHVIISL